MKKLAATNIPHVAFIDSGIGGLTILSQVQQAIPVMQVSYFMDNLFLPYGELASQQLELRLAAIVEFLQRLKPDVVVIACNTASTQSLAYLRAKFPLDFVGVVPAIKPAAEQSKNKTIGLLATPATVNSKYIQALVDEYAQDCQLISLGSSEVVACAEDYFWHGEQNRLNLPDLTCFASVDTVVLGCTHFPLIADVLAEQFALINRVNSVKLLDSGEAIARRVQQRLVNVVGFGDKTSTLFCSQRLSKFQIQRLKRQGFVGVELVDI